MVAEVYSGSGSLFLGKSMNNIKSCLLLMLIPMMYQILIICTSKYTQTTFTEREDFAWLCMCTSLPGQVRSVPQVLYLGTARVWGNGICLDLPISNWNRKEYPPLLRKSVLENWCRWESQVACMFLGALLVGGIYTVTVCTSKGFRSPSAFMVQTSGAESY